MFQEDQGAEIARGLLQALCYCHSKGIIHRNITTSNVLVEVNTDHPKRPIKGIKLTDFKEAIEVDPIISKRKESGLDAVER